MSLLFLIILQGMEDVKGNTDRNAAVNGNKKITGIVRSILENGEFLGVMIAFFLVNMCNWGTLTYLVNLIRELGGTDTIYGIACFVGSSSELPVMLLFGWMLKKTSCNTLLKISVVGYLLDVGGIREMLAIYAVISAAAVIILVAGMHLGGGDSRFYRR